MMNQNLTIYLVKNSDFNDVEEIYAVFDDLEMAEQFKDRFKTPGNLEIIKQILNPLYLRDKKRDPYYVALDKTSKVANEIYIADFITQAEIAKEEKYEILCDRVEGTDFCIFQVMLFAESATKATEKAILIRDAVIARGEWDLAVYESQGLTTHLSN